MRRGWWGQFIAALGNELWRGGGLFTAENLKTREKQPVCFLLSLYIGHCCGRPLSWFPYLETPLQVDKYHRVNTSVNYYPHLVMKSASTLEDSPILSQICFAYILILYKWNNTVSTLSSLASFAQYHVCEIHAYCVLQ